MAQKVHPDDPPHVLVIDRHESHERRDPDEQNDRKDEQREGREPFVKASCLGDQRQRQYGSGEDGEEHRGPAEGFVPAQGPGRQQTPVFGREDLESKGWREARSAPFGQHILLVCLGTATRPFVRHQILPFDRLGGRAGRPTAGVAREPGHTVDA